MKIAILMVATAISLFTGTVIWSARTTVERVITVDPVYSAPDRKTAHSWYYASQPAHTFSVNALVPVELDESFSGVELLGDTSVFKYFNIAVNKNPLLRSSVNVKTVTTLIPDGEIYPEQAIVSSSPKDSLINHLFDAAKVTIRIGIGTGSMNSERHFHFYSCKTITSIGAITNAAVLMDAGYTDSLFMEVQAKKFEFHSRTGKIGKPGRVAKLSGTANQVQYMIESVDLQAHDLVTQETYLTSTDSNIDIFATAIVNSLALVNSPLKISGNPPYQRIREQQQ